jgi:hypothetical protein
MSPVIKHLSTIFSDLPSPIESPLAWTFDKRLRVLGPDFYHKIVGNHPLFNLEYGLLCNQLRHNFLFPQGVAHHHLVERLIAALMLCELLEEVHLNYLVVPREVVRLRRQKKLFKTLLTEMGEYSFSPEQILAVDVGLSLSQQVRETTVQTNLYRILLNRIKRFLTLLSLSNLGSEAYRQVIGAIDNYTNPFFIHLGWFFHVPRLITNLFLIFKHTVPGSWMNEKEKSLDWHLRLLTQMQRRWFEMGNDVVWVAVGILTGFILTGALAPIAIYLSIAAFAFDVLNAAARAYIELKRLFTLYDEYNQILAGKRSEEEKQQIREYQRHLLTRINFETKRFAIHVTGTLLILAAMTLAIPALALNPILVLASAGFLLLLWLVNFMLTRKLESQRPNDRVEEVAQVSKLSFFSKRPEVQSAVSPLATHENTSQILPPSL